MSESNKSTIVGIVFIIYIFLMVCDLTYKPESQMQLSQATRAHCVDETWEGLAINILESIISHWKIIWIFVWYITLYDNLKKKKVNKHRGKIYKEVSRHSSNALCLCSLPK